MVKEMKDEKRKMNPILWFLFAIVVPIILVIALTVVIFSLAGANVFDWAKDKANDVPFLSSFVTTEAEEDTQRETEHVEQRIVSKDAEIEELKQEVQDKEATIESLELDKVKLESDPVGQDQTSSSGTAEEKDESTPVETISGSFKNMDSEQAALIMERLDKDTAVSILGNVSSKVRGKILGAMDPEKAADLTQLFINSEN